MNTKELGAGLAAKFGDRILGVDDFPGLLCRVRFDPTIAMELGRMIRATA